MSPEIKSRLKAVKEGIYVSLACAGLYLIFNIWENKTYVQPQVDKEQNISINSLTKRVSECDSMSSVKNSNANSRIDEFNDVIKPMALKINIMFNNDKRNEYLYQEIVRLQKLQTEN